MGRRRRGTEATDRSRPTPEAAINVLQSADEFNAQLDKIKRHSGKDWDPAWDGFLSSKANRVWWDGIGAEGRPVYVIRPEVTHALAEPGGRTVPAFSPEDARIEIAFHRMCRQYSHSIVAVAGGVPIRSPLEGKPVGLIDLLRRYRDTVPWADDLLSRQDERSGRGRRTPIERIAQVEENARTDVLDTAGRLVCSSDFARECDELRGLARELDLGIVFPLRREATDFNVTDDGGRTRKEILAPMDRFSAKKQGFFRKWFLSELVTWDLPAPLGDPPDMPAQLFVRMYGPNAMLRNMRLAHTPVRREDEHDSVGRISVPDSGLQRPARASPGNDTPRGHAYRFWLQELAVRQRFDGLIPYGANSKFEKALSTAFGVEETPVRRVRTLYLHQLRHTASQSAEPAH